MPESNARWRVREGEVVKELPEAVAILGAFFRSSAFGAFLIPVGFRSLPTGETYSHVCVCSAVLPYRKKLVRSFELRFSSGEDRETLCNFRMTVHVDDEVGVFAISEKIPSLRQDGKWEVRPENSYLNEAVTERWKFESALLRVSDLVEPLKGAKATKINVYSPLIFDRVRQIELTEVEPDERGR